MAFTGKKQLLSIFGFILLGIVWQITVLLLHSPTIPSILNIFSALWEMVILGDAWNHIIASLRYITAGFFLASIAGFLIGVLISQSKISEFLFMPIIDAIRPISALAIFPLLIMIIGIGFWSKTVVIFWTAYPAVILSTINGIYKVDKSVKEAGMIDGASKLTLLVKIIIPLASLDVMTGLRIALSGGWISLVAAEMLGSREGLGYYVMVAAQTFKFPQVYATIILISTMGLLMNWILTNIQKYIQFKYF
jgi:NitT/TauT family transport system permease protein